MFIMSLQRHVIRRWNKNCSGIPKVLLKIVNLKANLPILVNLRSTSSIWKLPRSMTINITFSPLNGKKSLLKSTFLPYRVKKAPFYRHSKWTHLKSCYFNLISLRSIKNLANDFKCPFLDICSNNSNYYFRYFCRAVHLYPHRFVGTVGHHDKSYPIEKLDVSYNGELIASISHDDCVKFWSIKYLEVNIFP